VSSVLVRVARLIVLIGACSSLGAPSFGGQQEAAPSVLDIRDVNNALGVNPGRIEDPQVCRMEARGSEDRRFVKRLWDDYGPVFGFKDWNNFGPDSAYRQIRLTHDGKTLTLKSWHPAYERNEKLVVTSQGVMLLEKQSRAEVLKKDDPDYVARREAFDSLVEKCLGRKSP
jgi:hypothetical protein